MQFASRQIDRMHNGLHKGHQLFQWSTLLVFLRRKDAVGVPAAPMHDQNRMSAIIQHFCHLAQKVRLALLLAKKAAADQINPIKLIVVRRGKSGTGYPNRMPFKGLGHLSIIQTFKLRHDGCPMLLGCLDLSWRCRRKNARLRSRPGRF